MPIQYINTGTSANKGDGDTLRLAFSKINGNFEYLNTATGVSGIPGIVASLFTGNTGIHGVNAVYDSTGEAITLILEPASSSTLGGVITGNNITNNNGLISVDSFPWINIVGKPTFARVAISGSYNDLTNTPTNVSYFVNDANYITETSLGNITFDGTTIRGAGVAATGTSVTLTQDRFSNVNLSNSTNISISDTSLAEQIQPGWTLYFADGITTATITSINTFSGQILINWNTPVTLTPGFPITAASPSYIPAVLDTVNVQPNIADTSTVWSFDSSGRLIIPNNGDIIRNGQSVLGNGNTVTNGAITVSEIDQYGTYSNIVTSTTAIRFDNFTGFHVADLGGGEVKVSLGSTFSDWKVDGQADLRAQGDDTIQIIAGPGITLTTNPNPTPYKSLTISSDLVYMNDLPPSFATTGTMWYDQIGGRLYVYFEETWVDASPVGGNASQFTLNPATTDTLGGVIIGSGINITGGGVISLYTATTATIGGVIIGSGINIDPNGVISVESLSWNNITGIPQFANVAFSGNYNDLTNTPTNVSYFVNDTGYLTSSTLGQFLTPISVAAGTDISVTTGSHGVIVSDTSTLESVTRRGATTDQIIILTTTTNSANTTTGALVIAGGLGVGGSVFAGALYDNGHRVITGASITSTAVTTLTAGTDTVVSSSNGDITIWGNSSLQSVTSRGATTNQAISITNNTSATSVGSAALTVTGGVGIGDALYVNGSTYIGGDLYVDGTQFIVNSTSISTVDKILYLSTNSVTTSTAAGSGISIGSTSTPFVDLLFDAVTGSWSSKGNINPNGTYALGSTAKPWNLIYGNQVYDTNNRVVTGITFTSGAGIGVVAVPATAPNLQFTINNLGVTSAVAGTGIGLSASTGTVTFSNLGVTRLNNSTGTITISGSTGVSVLSLGPTIQIGNTGVTGLNGTTGTVSLNSGTDITVTNNTFTNIIELNVTSTLDSVTTRGNISNQQIIINNVSSSTSNITGALQVAGGVGIQGDVFAGNIYSNGYPLSTQTLTIVGGADIAVTVINTSTIQIDNTSTLQTITNRGFSTTNAISILNTTPSGSTTTGALVLSGGLGVQGNVYAGNYYSNGFPVSTATLLTAQLNGITLGTVNVLNFSSGTTATISGTVVTVQAIAGISGVANINAGTDTAVSQATGSITIWDTSTLQSVTSRGATTNQAINISNPTASISTTTGALVVRGGVGIGGDLFVTGALNIAAGTKFTGNIDPNGSYALGSVSNPWNLIYGNQVYDNTNRVLTTINAYAGNGIGITGGTIIGPAGIFTVTNLGVTGITGGIGITASGSTGSVTLSIGQQVATTSSVQFANVTSTGVLITTQAVSLYTTKNNANGTVTHDCSTGETFYHTNPSTNWTTNLTNLSLASGQQTSINIIVAQTNTAHLSTSLQVGGVTQTVLWAGGSPPTGNANKTDNVTFTILSTGTTNYVVLGQIATYG